MSRQYSDYSAPSLDGYDAQLNSLFEYAPAPPINTQIEMDPRYISDCFKVSNNKYPDCPAIMDDGRAFTDYRSSCYINDIIRVKNGITNSYDYRQFLINNGNELINAIRLYNIQKSACRSCDAQPIDCQNICNVDRQSVNCSLNNACGFGTCYRAVPLPPSQYANKLSENRELATLNQY
jgi:hypothetical protein